MPDPSGATPPTDGHTGGQGGSCAGCRLLPALAPAFAGQRDADPGLGEGVVGRGEDPVRGEGRRFWHSCRSHNKSPCRAGMGDRSRGGWCLPPPPIGLWAPSPIPWSWPSALQGAGGARPQGTLGLWGWPLGRRERVWQKLEPGGGWRGQLLWESGQWQLPKV